MNEFPELKEDFDIAEVTEQEEISLGISTSNEKQIDFLEDTIIETDIDKDNDEFEYFNEDIFESEDLQEDILEFEKFQEDTNELDLDELDLEELQELRKKLTAANDITSTERINTGRNR